MTQLLFVLGGLLLLIAGFAVWIPTAVRVMRATSLTMLIVLVIAAIMLVTGAGVFSWAVFHG